MKNASPVDLLSELRRLAGELGFQHVGVAPVDGDLRQDTFMEWIEAGCHGEMAWMARDPVRRSTPLAVLPEARCILAFGLNYYQEESDRRGRIAKYALGKDYHKVMLGKLKRVCTWLQAHGGVNRPYVDTGPLLEKPIAALAGLGWQGKNTMLLNRESGQWLFLGFILTSISFTPGQPQSDRCGSCTRCLDVCPTGAITAPYRLDARRCISYLTIEHKGPIPETDRSLIGNHLYGCDDCLDVCPWNKWAIPSTEPAFAQRVYPDLRDMLSLDDDGFNNLFAGSPIRRLKRARWLRNACIVLGNTGTPDDLSALQKASLDPDPLIAEHAAWAISEITQRCHPLA